MEHPATGAGAPPVEFVVDDVRREFGGNRRLLNRKHGTVTALDGVSLEVLAGESLGLVGESGSGKTTLGRLMVAFDEPTSGEVRFRGSPLAHLSREERRAFVGEVQMVFQNPYAALNPFRTVRDSLSAGIRIRRRLSKEEIDAELTEVLDRVGLHASMLDRYPHQFSGGQRQRIVLARALSVSPSVLIADEPVSALDVSIQAQVLNLLNDLKQQEGHSLTIVMITHDLAVANFFCDRIAVMYAGRIVEVGRTRDVVDAARHPYTRMLLSAAPNPDPTATVDRPWVRSELAATPPPREGCVFAPRCWLREVLGNPDECLSSRPEPSATGRDHRSACHFSDDVEAAALAARAGPPSASDGRRREGGDGRGA